MLKAEARNSKRIGTRAITFALIFSVAGLVASGVSYGKKPPVTAALNPVVCAQIGGVWAGSICTIDETTSGVVDSGFQIYNGVTLDVKGSLVLNAGVTIANAGTIIVENVGGVPSTPFDDDIYKAGILVFGTLDNSGTITIQNVYPNTEGITVSVSYTQNADPPSPYTVVPGTLTNSGTITIQNQDQTRGIKNLGTLANSASGTINVQNSLTTSVGIYNRRDDALVPNYYYVRGTITNAGTVTISNSGKSVAGQYGYGVYNGALITTTGTFTINASSTTDTEVDDAGGFYNSGSFTNYGTLNNYRGGPQSEQGAQVGSFNNEGTMINYGTTNTGTAEAPYTGTFINWRDDTSTVGSMMINLGKIISYGIFADFTPSITGGVPTMINFGEFYNYGAIGGGENRGICIDEHTTGFNGTGC